MSKYRYIDSKIAVKFLIKSLTICTLFGVSINIDFLPQYSRDKGLGFGKAVLAQNSISDEDLKKYAQAATAIETLRRNTFNNIQSTMGQSSPPQLSCHQPKSFNQLPENAKNMAVSYCQQSEDIVKNNGLSINQFNQIHQQVKRDSALQQRLKSLINN